MHQQYATFYLGCSRPIVDTIWMVVPASIYDYSVTFFVHEVKATCRHGRPNEKKPTQFSTTCEHNPRECGVILSPLLHHWTVCEFRHVARQLCMPTAKG